LKYPASLEVLALGVAAAALLSGCGGGDAPAASSATATASTAAPTAGAQVESVPVVAVQPTFHRLPMALAEPGALDADGSSSSAAQPPHAEIVPAQFEGIDTARLTEDKVQSFLSRRPTQGVSAQGSSGTAATVYTPAQIRAAYGFSTLPTSYSGLSASAAAALGAGQTIYILDSNDNPNALADLNTFSSRFGLPACTLQAASAPASKSGCTFSLVYVSSSGAAASSAPAYDSGWATEIALDVQWSHAIAPLARIVLVEVATPSNVAIGGALKLINAMGPGVVSMSFASPEGSWETSYDSLFTGNGMSYFAATGDSGSGVGWPSSSPNVVAVGGTSLSYSGSGTRSEVTWSKTGGGISAFEARPSYQGGVSVSGQTTPLMRVAADVAFNADPNTGQYVAVTAPGGSTTWYACGGTSLATPQWAALTAVANAMRVAASQSTLVTPQTALYQTVAANASLYASAFDDIVSGNDGACAWCAAKAGYDAPTGLGTPNAGTLLSALAGSKAAAAVVPAPVVPGGSLTVYAGKSLSVSLGVTQPAATGVSSTLNYTLSGAPSGMSVSSGGVLNWAAPVKGSYSITVTATNSAGVSAKGVYVLTVAVANPVVATGTVTATAGMAISVPVMVSNAAGNAVSLSLSGAPSGMSLSGSNVVWSKAVAGSYAVVINAKDTVTGATGQGTYTVKISAH